MYSANNPNEEILRLRAENKKLRAALAAEKARGDKAYADGFSDGLAQCSLEIVTLRAALIDTLASLVASIDLLERGGKKAAPSNKMFEQMLVDYKNSIERGRTAAAALKETGNEN